MAFHASFEEVLAHLSLCSLCSLFLLECLFDGMYSKGWPSFLEKCLATPMKTRVPTDVITDARHPNVSFFLARHRGCLKMPGDEEKSRNRPENHARSAIISSTTYVSTDNCTSRTTTRRGINKIPKCFSSWRF